MATREEWDREDGELVRATRRGDGRAFERLLCRYKPHLGRIAKRYAQPGAELDDLIQTGRICLYELAARDYREDKPYSFYVTFLVRYRSAILNVLKTIRGESKDERMRQRRADLMRGATGLDEDWEEDKGFGARADESSGSDPAYTAAVRDEADWARRWLGIVAPNAVQIFELLAEGLTAREVAQRLGLKPKAVETRILVAQRRMRTNPPTQKQKTGRRALDLTAEERRERRRQKYRRWKAKMTPAEREAHLARQRARNATYYRRKRLKREGQQG